MRGLWQAVVADLRDYGAEGELRSVWEGEVGFSFDVSYQGPLYDGRDRSKGKVRLDVSLRGEPSATRRELVRSEYDDVRPFVVTVLRPEHLLAEKVRALLVRAKPRDFYDVWLMVEQGVNPDADLIGQKLKLHEMTLTPTVVDAALTRALGLGTRSAPASGAVCGIGCNRPRRGDTVPAGRVSAGNYTVCKRG